MVDDDPYSVAKTSLRDNVKWLATSFAAIAAAVLAGTPFSGFGALPVGLRFVAALIALVLASVGFFSAWKALIFTLRPDAIYAEYLRSSFDIEKIQDKKEKAELEALKAEFKKRVNDLLPDGFNSLEAFEDKTKALWTKYQQSDSDNHKKEALEQYRQYQKSLGYVHDWAAYTRLHIRVERGLRAVGLWGLMALIGVITFAWAANPGKSNCCTASTIVGKQNSGPAVVAPPSADEPLRAVRFQLGKADLLPEGIEAVGKARDLLRRRSDAGLLLLAHTDTLGTRSINGDLAHRRAKEVHKLLTVEGGISSTRVFLAELPESDLPILTRQQSERAENRAVEFVVVTLPPR